MINNSLKFACLDDENRDFVRFCSSNKVEISILKIISNNIDAQHVTIINLYSLPRPHVAYTLDNF